MGDPQTYLKNTQLGHWFLSCNTDDSMQKISQEINLKNIGNIRKNLIELFQIMNQKKNVLKLKNVLTNLMYVLLFIN